jgi:hypothetical protein
MVLLTWKTLKGKWVDAFLKKHASHCWDFSKIKCMFLGKIILVNYIIVGIALPLKSGFEIAFRSFVKKIY